MQQVVFERKVDTEGTPEKPVFKTVKRMLFSKMNPFPQKKVLTFNKNSQDFSFSVNYAELEHLRPEDIEWVLVQNNIKLTHCSD